MKPLTCVSTMILQQNRTESERQHQQQSRMKGTPTGEKLGETEALEGQRELGSLVSMGFTNP